MDGKFLRLKQVLGEKNETGRSLSKKLGVSEMTVSRWVANQKMPGIDTLHEIAVALGVDVCELLAGSRYPGGTVERSAGSVAGASGAVLAVVEVDKSDGSRFWLGGVFADVETMVSTMRGRGAKFPDVEAVASMLADGAAHIDGVNGRRFVVFRDAVQAAPKPE